MPIENCYTLQKEKIELIMNKNHKLFIQQYSDNEDILLKMIVTAFAINNDLEIKSGYLKRYYITDLQDFKSGLSLIENELSIEDVINIFELSIPSAERTTNGAVYTPKFIRDYIVQNVFNMVNKPLENCLCADVSCGCGAFLYTTTLYLRAHTNMTYHEIYRNIYGVDISATSIERAKVLLCLIALTEGENIESDIFNLNSADSLLFDFASMPQIALNNGFDIIVGNPPYVRSKNIDEVTKKNLPLWSTSKIGNADLYIPFFEIGLSNLNEHGILGYITVNSFFKSVNARALRDFFSNNHTSLHIIDFGQQLIFEKKLAYTCLTFISKQHSNSISYVKAQISDIIGNVTLMPNVIEYSTLNNHKGWNLNQGDILENIAKIENAGESLGHKYTIKNGIATLANDVFIFKPTGENEICYFVEKDGKTYEIEKDICKSIIKPNILKSEAEINLKEERVIFPYDSSYNVIGENYFQQHYPNAYAYLLAYKDKLDQRDKGNGDYGAWFAFGRTQAISDKGKKLLFPYMSDIPHFVYTDNAEMLIYCGYAIYHESDVELRFLKRILESDIFDYYMKHTSKPYSTGYYSYAKNYVKSFGIYPFSEEDKNRIISMPTMDEVNRFLSSVYKVNI